MNPNDDQTTKRSVGERVQLNLGIDGVETKDLGEGVLEAIITTSIVDRHGEVIETEGIDTDSYMNNPVVLYGHNYSALPIGRTLKLTKTKNKIKAKFELAINEYPFAMDVYKMVKGGFLNAVSIGGVVREWSEDWTRILKMDMVEFSIVPVPANEEAIITGRSLEAVTGKTQEQVAKEFKDFVRQSIFDKADSMGDDDLDKTIKTLDNLLVTLKSAADEHAKTGKQAPATVRKKRYLKLKMSAQKVATESNRVVRVVKLINR